ncbi:MAG: hypothetical protein AB6733_20270 [Clostridiaceae bacterium]
MNVEDVIKLEERVYELEKKQELLLSGIDKLLDKHGIKVEDNLELYALSMEFTYEEFMNLKEFLVKSSIKLHNENITREQFIDDFSQNFSKRKPILPKLMEVIRKSGEFEFLCNHYFN